MDGAPEFTPYLPPEQYCPACLMPPLNDRAEIAPCSLHQPAKGGAEDGAVPDAGYFNIGEANGDNGRAIQALIVNGTFGIGCRIDETMENPDA